MRAKILAPIIGLFMALASPAVACPDYTLWGQQQYTYTGNDLWTPRPMNVVAGGNNNMTAHCRHIRARNWNGPMPGFMITPPDFSVTVRGIRGYQLEFRVVSDCDATLLINTAGVNWYFDDDDNGNLDPKIRLTRPAGDGIYDVWVGSYDGSACNAQLIMETF
ncbi:hypothetical protein [Cochlodiniinecator piscidefendens]|uniref:hypothetical protein n=1 Tax=Cochlodiniinecator piscidefendens TaxID=2715756 RepID=UPI001E40DC28|nr:hypothetical protein [Cochlodiniinecator piscidefendens]